MVQVGNAQIAPGAVTTTNIATGAVTTGDIADGALSPQTIQQASDVVLVDPEESEPAIAFCPPSHPTVTGGGFQVQAGGRPHMHASDSYGGIGEWTVFMYNNSPTVAFTFTAFATCMAPMP
jgi:hypothetical protein